eukprot:728185-Alexandrium_andersonii.AAC.1
MLSGDWEQTRPSAHLHLCPLGCCLSPQVAKKKAWKAVLSVWLNTVPRIPALNRWTKLYQPIVWFLMGISMHGLLPEAVQNVLNRAKASEASRSVRAYS